MVLELLRDVVSKVECQEERRIQHRKRIAAKQDQLEQERRERLAQKEVGLFISQHLLDISPPGYLSPVLCTNLVYSQPTHPTTNHSKKHLLREFKTKQKLRVKERKIKKKQALHSLLQQHGHADLSLAGKEMSGGGSSVSVKNNKKKKKSVQFAV